MTNPFAAEPTLTDLERLLASKDVSELQDFVYRCNAPTRSDVVRQGKSFVVSFCYSESMWSACSESVQGKMGLGQTPEDALSALIR